MAAAAAAARSPEASRLSSILRRCARTPSILAGDQAHARALTLGLLPDATLETDLVLLYSRSSRLDLARKLFDRMPQRNLHSWNILISSYARSSIHSAAIALLPSFIHSGLRPDHFTLPSLLKAAAGLGDRSLPLGESLHRLAIALGLDNHLIVQSSALCMYANCGGLDSAHRLFEAMPVKDHVVWNTMISGFARSGLLGEALSFLQRSRVEGFSMDPMVVPSILVACGRGGDLMRGKVVHGRVIRCCLFGGSDTAIANSLIDMYAKCGSLGDARKVFLIMGERNLVSWSALVSCYGAHGRGEECLRLFDEMISKGFKPNRVTFTSVLSSCSHLGMVGEGQMVFEAMIRGDHGVVPGVEHYACMVDLLGRSGRVKESLAVIERMPMEPEASVWGALLGACALHKDVEVGEIAAQKLFELESGNPSNYVALCGIYDAVGLVNGVSKVRTRMRDLGMVKTPGCSWISVKGRTHTFYKGGAFHRPSKRIQEILMGWRLHEA